MPYAILMNELKPLDLKKTASILAKAEYAVYADASRGVRNGCGISAERHVASLGRCHGSMKKRRTLRTRSLIGGKREQFR